MAYKKPGADPKEVQRFIENIVRKLIESQTIGNSARVLLDSLDPDPETIVDDIIRQLGLTLTEVVESLDDEASAVDRGASFDNISRKSQVLADLIDADPTLRDKIIEEFGLSVADNTGKAVVGSGVALLAFIASKVAA